MYNLNNTVSSSPSNASIGYNNSWINVSNNAGRELFAQANYITNFEDMTLTLSAADVNIGNVHLSDATTGLHADVVSVGIGSGALRVISQDLESSDDDVTIGDRVGNFASIYAPLSALNVYIKNPTIYSVPYSYTIGETKTNGNPSFLSKQVIIHNLNNTNVDVNLTLTSGTSCNIPIGKNTSSNHIMTLNIEVSTVNIYNGCSITFLA